MFEELENSKSRMMDYEKERHMLQQRMNDLEVSRSELRHYKEFQNRDEHNDSEMEAFFDHYATISDEYAQVRKNLEMSSMKYQEMQHHIMDLEKEVAHRMKYIEQENAADL